MNLKDLQQLDEKSLMRLGAALVVLSLAIGPGALLLFLEQSTELLSASIIVVVGVSLVLSIHFHFLGGVVYLHPYKTLEELSVKPQNEAIWNMIIGTGMWAVLSAAGAYALVHGGSEWLSNAFTSIPIRYVVVYVVVATPFCALFSINYWRLKKLHNQNDR